MKIKTCTFKGKSRLCSYYIHCKSFDGDLLALNLRKEHPEWEERWINESQADCNLKKNSSPFGDKIKKR